MRSQTLLQSAIRTVARIVRLYDRLMEILGNLSGQQQLSEHLTQLVTLQTQQNVAGMASQLAENMDRLQEPLILESLDRINVGDDGHAPKVEMDSTIFNDITVPQAFTSALKVASGRWLSTPCRCSGYRSHLPRPATLRSGAPGLESNDLWRR